MSDTVCVNGQDAEYDDCTTVADVVFEYASSTDGIAVAVDGCVIPKEQWSAMSLKERNVSTIDIVTAVQGG